MTAFEWDPPTVTAPDGFVQCTSAIGSGARCALTAGHEGRHSSGHRDWPDDAAPPLGLSRRPALPAVGARIRVTRTHASGTTAVVEGVVRRHEPAKEAVLLDGRWAVNLTHKADGWTITVEVLEEAPPALSEEPPAGTILLVGPDVWVRQSDGESVDGWVCTGTAQVHGWADIAPDFYGPRVPEWRKPVVLVEAPLLAELIEAVRETAPAWHEKECTNFDGEPGFEVCTRTECVEWRALLAKVTGEAPA